MAVAYHPRRFSNSPLYRLLQDHWDIFLASYEDQFQHQLGALRSVIEQVVPRYLDCGNPMNGFARIRCPDCGGEMHLLSFITESGVVDRILRHVGWRHGESLPGVIRPPPEVLKVAESPA